MKYPKCFDGIADILDDVLEGPLAHQKADDYFRRMALTMREVLKIQIRLIGALEPHFEVGSKIRLITNDAWRGEIGTLIARGSNYDWEVELSFLSSSLFNEDEMELLDEQNI